MDPQKMPQNQPVRVGSPIWTATAMDAAPKDTEKGNGGSRTVLYARVSTTDQTLDHQRTQAEAAGFKATVEDISYDASRAGEYPIKLQIGATAETIEVTAGALTVNTEDSALNGRNYTQLQQLEATAKKQEQNAASANVMNLQRRVAGVLPVAVEVPRTGTSFQFVRPLVLDEETKVTFSYKSK